LENTVGAAYTYEAELRIYRDATLIFTRTSSFNGSIAGTFDVAIGDTYVDTAVATTTSTYELRVEYTVATNVTTANAVNTTLNVIVFI
jgi:hypothetical protein